MGGAGLVEVDPTIAAWTSVSDDEPVPSFVPCDATSMDCS